jgi:hypothetical protein
MYGTEQTCLHLGFYLFRIARRVERTRFPQKRLQEPRLNPIGDSVSMDQQDNWQELYQAALLEVDPGKMAERIQRAYQVIQLQMALGHQNGNGAERQALADALANLRVLQREIGLPLNDPSHNERESSASNR